MTLTDEADNNAEPRIEASWAPKDPRDRLYDAEASRRDKAASILRVVGAFHPILNLFILAFDSVKKLGALKAALFWGFLFGCAYGLYHWITL